MSAVLVLIHVRFLSQVPFLPHIDTHKHRTYIHKHAYTLHPYHRSSPALASRSESPVPSRRRSSGLLLRKMSAKSPKVESSLEADDKNAANPASEQERIVSALRDHDEVTRAQSNKSPAAKASRKRDSVVKSSNGPKNSKKEHDEPLDGWREDEALVIGTSGKGDANKRIVAAAIGDKEQTKSARAGGHRESLDGARGGGDADARAQQRPSPLRRQPSRVGVGDNRRHTSSSVSPPRFLGDALSPAVIDKAGGVISVGHGARDDAEATQNARTQLDEQGVSSDADASDDRAKTVQRQKSSVKSSKASDLSASVRVESTHADASTKSSMSPSRRVKTAPAAVRTPTVSVDHVLDAMNGGDGRARDGVLTIQEQSEGEDESESDVDESDEDDNEEEHDHESEGNTGSVQSRKDEHADVKMKVRVCASVRERGREGERGRERERAKWYLCT